MKITTTERYDANGNLLERIVATEHEYSQPAPIVINPYPWQQYPAAPWSPPIITCGNDWQQGSFSSQPVITTGEFQRGQNVC